MPTIQRPLLNMMDYAYRIRDFSELFETNESRKRSGPMEWTKMRTKHDGRSFRRITRARTGESALLGWYLMLQVAAKMPARGLLADLQGPLDAEDLEDKTGISKKVFAAAMIVLTEDKIGWLERVDWDPNGGFDHNLARLGIQRSGPADNGSDRQTPADTGRHPRGKKAQSHEGTPAGNGSTQSSTGSDRQTPADTGRPRQTTAGSGTHNSTEKTEITDIPPTVPQGGQEAGEEIHFAEAKQLLHALFDRKKRTWSYEEDQLLHGVAPLPRELWPLIEAWFRLPDSHPVFQVTKRKHELTTFLRDFNGEVDKMQRHAPLFGESEKNAAAKKEPARWREFFRWKYGAECQMPERFDQLGRTQRDEWEREHVEFDATIAPTANEDSAAA